MYITHIYFFYYPIKRLCAVFNSVTDTKGYFIHLGIICSVGDESDLELERKYKEDDREKTPRRPRTQRTEKVQKIPSGKEAGQISGVKKPIISVVLTAHEAIPGDHSKQEGAKRIFWHVRTGQPDSLDPVVLGSWLPDGVSLWLPISVAPRKCRFLQDCRG